MFGHAGAVLINLHVTPEVLRISGRQHAARVNGLRPLATDFAAALCVAWRCQHAYAAALRIAWRCQRAHGEPHGKRSQTFLEVDHDESPFPSIVAPSHDTSRRRGRTRLIRLAASD